MQIFRSALSVFLKPNTYKFCSQAGGSLEKSFELNFLKQANLPKVFAKIHQFNTELHFDERSLAVEIMILAKLGAEKQNETTLDMKELLEKLINSKINNIQELSTIFKIIHLKQSGLIDIEKEKIKILIVQLCNRLKNKSKHGFSMDGWLLNQLHDDAVKLDIIDQDIHEKIEQIYLSSLSRMSLINVLKFLNKVVETKRIFSTEVLNKTFYQLKRNQDYISAYSLGIAAQIYMGNPYHKEIKEFLRTWIDESIDILYEKTELVNQNPLFKGIFSMHEMGEKSLKAYFKITSDNNKLMKILELVQTNEQ